jgi:hypothetical protein
MIGHKAFITVRIGALLCGAALIASGKALADQVIADDLIVQGSTCTGFDCVNNESFGFDTLRLKENNTRINFFDTSTGAGFPANHWTLTANDSANGGANKFSIDDVTGVKTPFTVIAGAPTNAMFVASTGKVGFRTSTPALDLHVTTSDTPAHRLEQTGAGGFTPQTWDIAGNEANFFVRDLTGGSRLPFRIRPGAPTSSLDIAADGNVGIGNASPDATLHIVGATGAIRINRTTGNTGDWRIGPGNAIDTLTFSNIVANTDPVVIAGNGAVGIGTVAPQARLHTTGTVRFAGVTSCAAGIKSDGNGDLSCVTSSRQFKTVTGELSPQVALRNVMALSAQTGSYKDTPDVPEHWLIAEDVAAVDPALAGLADGKPYTVKTQNIVADLVAVVQQQQRRIDELERRLSAK